MASKDGHNGHKTETPDVSHIRNVEVTHETSDISVRGVLTFAVVLGLSIIAAGIGIRVMFQFFNKQEARAPKPGPMALEKTAEERLPPGPRLQSAPGFSLKLENGQTVNLEKTPPSAEYRELRAQWEENLKTGLKDQSGKVVGMPITDAMKKVASEGLPSKIKGGDGKLEDYAVRLPTAASSGRATEKRVQ